ncbi:MAG TPA: hypothetical protein PKK43_13025 [Spirochaetota bacterium]|nr:hypothetical protein [Spirochaetota bacterium]
MPKPRTMLSFIFTIFICDLFIVTQHLYVPPRIRIFTAFIFVTLAFTGYFFLVRPESLVEHAKWVSIICGLVCLTIILVQDIMIRKMLTPKFLIVAVIAAAAPLAGAGVYYFLNKEKLRKDQ